MIGDNKKPPHKRRAVMREDSPEQIQKCLNCNKSRCINCIAMPKGEVKKKTKGRAVIAFGNGEERYFDSIREAARVFVVTPNAVQQALRLGKKCQGYYWRYYNETTDI